MTLAIYGDLPTRRALVDAAVGGLDQQGYDLRLQAATSRSPTARSTRASTTSATPCGMNRVLLCGMADAVGDEVLTARLAPSAGSCCVRLDANQHPTKDR